MMNATRMARISRTVMPALAPGVTWSTRTESTTGELGPVSAKDRLVLAVARHGYDSFIRFRYQMYTLLMPMMTISMM